MARIDTEIQDGPLTVRRTLEPNRIRLTLAGELDLSNAGTVDAALTEAWAEDEDIVIDLGPLEFLDSTGIALIVRALGEEQAARLSFLPSDSDQVRRLLGMTGLDQRMPISAAEDVGGLLPAA